MLPQCKHRAGLGSDPLQYPWDAAILLTYGIACSPSSPAEAVLGQPLIHSNSRKHLAEFIKLLEQRWLWSSRFIVQCAASAEEICKQLF